MHFPTLLATCDAPETIRRLADELIERKATTRELGTGELPESLAAFIDGEFEVAKTFFEIPARLPNAEARADAQRFFLEALERRNEF